MKINLHIDRIVLDGIELSSNDKVALRDAITSKLSQLLRQSDQTEFRQTRNHRVSFASIETGRNPDATVLGSKIAQSIGGGFLR